MSLKKKLGISLVGEMLSKLPLYGFEFILASTLVLYDYAQWSALLIFFRFAPYCHFGIMSYFNKRYPRFIGKELLKAKWQINSRSNGAINVLLLCYSMISIFLFVAGFIGVSELMVIGAILLMQVYVYCQAKVRNEGDFVAFTIGLLLFSVIQFVSALFLVSSFNVFGAILSVLIGYSCAVVYYLFIAKCDYKWQLVSFRSIFRVVKLGALPFLLTISTFLVQIADRIALVIAGNKENLAFYGFFAIFLQLGIVIVNSTGKVLGPYIISKTAASGVQDTVKVGLYNCYFIFLFYFVFSFFLYLFGDWLIERYFTNFSGSLLGLFNYTAVGLIMAIGLVFYPQLIAMNCEKNIIKLNFTFGLILMLGVYFSSLTINGYVGFSLVSLTLNALLAQISIWYVERSMGLNLKLVKAIVIAILSLTYLVNFYVWN